jgi:hypothetical protein
MAGAERQLEGWRKAMRVPTSVVLENLIRDAPADVSLEWIGANLQQRSFGIVMLLIALLGLVPGLSLIAGVMLAVLAFQMILGRREPVLPRRLAVRRLSRERLARNLDRVIPVFRRLERVVRPRWGTHFEMTKRVIGFVILLLGATLLAPVPFSHIIPALVIMLLAFAYLEEDGILLCIALAAAALSLAITAVAVWGAIEASGFW